MFAHSFFLIFHFVPLVFLVRKSYIYSQFFSSLFLLIFEKIFSFFKSHSLFKLFWNCDWHVFRTCRFFFLKKIEGLFFCTLAHETAIENVCCFRAKKEKLSQAIKKNFRSASLTQNRKYFLNSHRNFYSHKISRKLFFSNFSLYWTS